MDFWNDTLPTLGWYTPIPEPDFDTETLLTEATNPVLEKITFAVRVFLFITCLVENGIAVFILCKSVKNAGRKTFAQYMLISIACADILNALVYYPGVFVQFSHGEFVWLVEGLIGDILCKLYNFLVNLPGKVMILSLIGLACDALRNSSPKGHKEHTKKFSIVATTLFWIAASGLSAVYLGISKVQSSFPFNECRPIETISQLIAVLTLHFVFVVIADITLAILNIVVFIRIRRRVQEMKERKGREREMAKPHSKTRRHREITHKTDQKMQPATSSKSLAKDCVIKTSDPSEPPSMGSEILSEMASAKVKGNALGNTEASVTDSKTSAVNEASKTHAKRNKPRKVKAKARDSENVTGQSAEEEMFQTTRNEAKIMAAVSIPFLILSIVMLILHFVCLSCSMYVFYAILMAGEIFAVIKPAIYNKTDNEFSERYRQLSPFACCCLRRARHCSE